MKADILWSFCLQTLAFRETIRRADNRKPRAAEAPGIPEAALCLHAALRVCVFFQKQHRFLRRDA